MNREVLLEMMKHDTWPEVFTEDTFVYIHGEQRKALADGYKGWSFCHFGKDIPEGFGEGMIKIAKFLKIDNALPETFDKYVKDQGL